MKRRAALYARTAAWDKSPTHQLLKLRSFVESRAWETTEFVDDGVSIDAKRRPALEALLVAVRNREIDVVVCTAMDRLVATPDELMALMQEFAEYGIDVEVIEP